MPSTNVNKAKHKSPESEEVDVIRIGEKERFTGRRIISFGTRNPRQSIKTFSRRADLKLASSSDYNFSTTVDYSDAFELGSGIFYEKLGIAVLGSSSNDALNFIMESDFSLNYGLEVEPERYIYAFDYDENSLEYEWGVNAINPNRKKLNNQYVKIAVLDTGIATMHSDFRHLNIVSNTFISGQDVEDGNGHGTHCAGVAFGGITSQNNKRFGISATGEMLIGKVLGNNGKSMEDSVLAGIEWAIENNAKVISLSLGSVMKPGESFSPSYERAASRALKSGTLIIAAAGNESMRKFGSLSPVCHPANCPSIMAVGAVDSQLNIADFSCTSSNSEGGKIDLVAPGVKILSTWKGGGYKSLSGTSMATPFVAGIAARLFEQFPSSDGFGIWAKLLQSVKPLNLPGVDVGAGLLQA